MHLPPSISALIFCVITTANLYSEQVPEAELESLIQLGGQGEIREFKQELDKLKARYPSDSRLKTMEKSMGMALRDVALDSLGSRARPISHENLSPAQNLRFILLHRKWSSIADLTPNLQPTAARNVMDELSLFLRDHPLCGEARILQAHLAASLQDEEAGREAVRFLKNWGSLEKILPKGTFAYYQSAGWLEAPRPSAPLQENGQAKTADVQSEPAKRLAEIMKQQKKK